MEDPMDRDLDPMEILDEEDEEADEMVESGMHIDGEDDAAADDDDEDVSEFLSGAEDR